MKVRFLAFAVIASGGVVLARPARANPDPPVIKICAVDLDGDQHADSYCMGYGGCAIGPAGCHPW